MELAPERKLFLSTYDAYRLFSCKVYLASYVRRYLPGARIQISTNIIRKYFATNVPRRSEKLMEAVIARLGN